MSVVLLALLHHIYFQSINQSWLMPEVMCIYIFINQESFSLKKGGKVYTLIHLYIVYFLVWHFEKFNKQDIWFIIISTF